MEPSGPGAEVRYRAFISYSHEDERWARWLQRALETYRVPPRLVGMRTVAGVVPSTLAPVFRDRSDFATATDLAVNIRESLHASANLIVVCSTHARDSRWVNEEVEAFRKLGRAERIFCLIVDGEPQASEIAGREAEECLPPALRVRYDTDGRPTAQRNDPVAADVRRGGDGKGNAKLKIVAGLLGVAFDALKQREHHRRFRHLVAVTSLALAATALMTVLAVSALIERKAAERRQKQAESLVNFMLGDLTDKLRQVQRLDILAVVYDQAMAYFVSLPVTDVTDQALAQRAKALEQIGSVRSDQGQLPAALESFRAAATLAEELHRRTPDDAARAARYAEILNWFGNVYWFQGDFPHALEKFRQSVTLLEQASAHRPQDTELADQLASARTNTGRVLEATGDLAAAKSLYEAVRSTFESLVDREPGTALWRTELGDAYDSLGKIALEQGQLAQAVAAYRDVRSIEADVCKRDPHNREAQESLVRSDAILGRTLALCGDDGAAAHYAREALTIARTLVAFDASQAPWREDVGDYSRLLGEMERRAGHFDDAAVLDAEAVRGLGELVATDRTNTGWQRELAGAELELARLELERGHLSAADQPLAAAQSAVTALRAQNPADRGLRLLESQVLLALGDLAARRHDLITARLHWGHARDAVAGAAKVGEDPNFLAAWAGAFLRLNDVDGARPLIDRLVAMGYRSVEFDRLLASRGLTPVSTSVMLRCGGDEAVSDSRPAPP